MEEHKIYSMLNNDEDPVFRGCSDVVLAIIPQGESREDGVIALATFELAAQGRDLGTFWCGILKDACKLEEVK